jgi:hypothetical protein
MPDVSLNKNTRHFFYFLTFPLLLDIFSDLV